MEITPLSSVRAFRFNYRVRVRVCRTWRAIRFGAENYSGLHCVMVDEQGTSIHGFMPEDQVADMIEQPVQGQMYEVHRFSTKQHYSGLRPVNNSVIVHFNGHTVFSKVPETVPPIPSNCFRLVEFSKLDAEREAHAIPSSQAVLADVYGCIKSIRPPHPQYIKSQNKNGVKCEFVLENLGREALTVVFWGKLARDFNVDAITSLPPPVVAVFTGLKITQYNYRPVANNYEHTCVLLNPHTPLSDAYKAEFSKPGDKAVIQGDFHVFESTEPKNTVSVQGLTGLDPAEHKSRSVLCKGQIIKIGANGWWYRRCPEMGCYKQCYKVEELQNRYRCRTHGVRHVVPCFRVNTLIGDELSDVTVTIMGNQAQQLFGWDLDTLRGRRVYITEQVIPPEISAVIGQVRVFELKGNGFGEWVAVAVGPEEEITPIPSPVKGDDPVLASVTDDTPVPPTIDCDETTSSSALSETTLHTPEKSCVRGKRVYDGIRKALFPETKQSRRETKGPSEESSTAGVEPLPE